MLIVPSSRPAVNVSHHFTVESTQEFQRFDIFDSVAVSRVFGKRTWLDLSRFEPDYESGGKEKYCRDEWLNVRYSRDFNGYKHITAEFQIPLALGHSDNLFCEQTVADITNALGSANERLSSLLGVEFDLAGKGKLIYVDANRDFALPNKNEYLEIFKRLEVARMVKTPYKTGVMFANKQTQIKIYDKFAQLENRHRELPQRRRNFADSYLRIETRKSDDALVRDIVQIHGDSDKTAGKVLTPEFASYIVNTSLARLEMLADLLSFDEWKKRVRESCEFRPQTLACLIKFAEEINRLGINKVKKRDSRNFKHRTAQLRKIGLSQLVFANTALTAINKFSNDKWWDLYD